MGENPGALVGLVTALVALSEALKYLITRAIPQKQVLAPEDQRQRDATREGVALLVATIPELKKAMDAVHEVHDLSRKLWEVHDRRDEDGVPLWYVPRSLGNTLIQAVEQMRQVSEIQRKTVETLDRIDRRLERLERRRLTTVPPLGEEDDPY